MKNANKSVSVSKTPTSANRSMNAPVYASKNPSPANTCANPKLKGKITKK